MNDFNADRFAAFSAAYLTGLTEAVRANPDDYTPNMVASVTGGAVACGGVPAVHAKMMEALRADTANIQGKGFANACKALGIKHARWAIFDFLKGE